VLTLSTESYGRIARMLDKGVPVTLEAEVRNRFLPEPDSGYNLLAEVRGREAPDEVVMFGAHFDGFHFATSVTDNGANVATMMEALRILRATGVPLRRTVRLALWTGEEQGLLGSKAYVQRHFADTLTHTRRPAADSLAAYYNLDNGAGAIVGAMAQWDIQPDMVVDSTFRAWTRLLSPDLGLRIVSARGGGGTDHVSFYTNRLPGYQFMQDWIEYDTRTHHSNADTYERVVPEDVRRNAVIVASFVYLTANAPGRFPAPILSGR
jgi:Zn-dependent M28 family amino/carboxypeptidase